MRAHARADHRLHHGPEHGPEHGRDTGRDTGRISAASAALVRLLLGLLLALVLPVAAATAQTQTRTITGPEALLAALEEDLTGVTLALVPGTYPAITLRGPGTPAAIRSADPAAPAVLLGLQGTDVDGLHLDGLVFEYRFGHGDPLHIPLISLTRCQDLRLTGSRIEGDVARGLGFPADGHGYGIGLNLRDCRDVQIEGNLIRGFWRAVAIRESARLVLRDNEITRIRMDGLTFAQVGHVLIEGNHIHDFDRVDVPEDHADMIQIWTASTTAPSHDILIRGNLLNSGQSLWTQSIWMRNERVDGGEAGREMFYRNIAIEDNLILNAHLHGIGIGETDGLVIRGNTMLLNRASVGLNDDWRRTLYHPRIRVAPGSTRVAIANNITHLVDGPAGQPDWLVAGNLLLQAGPTPTGPGQVPYARVFVDGGHGGAPWRPETWQLIRGGPGDRDGLGASALR